jgi:regulator of protease activity HflC (stomatin/prohibitin superfamily)
MRSHLPTLELDAVFEAKEELALTVKNALVETMTLYGYQIVQVLITDIDPDQRVKVRSTAKVVGRNNRRQLTFFFIPYRLSERNERDQQ